MRRPLRRYHFALWVLLTPVFIALIGYAVSRTPVDKTDPDAPGILFENGGGR